jgi:hypothetical protein
MQKTIKNALFGAMAMPAILASTLTINPANIDQAFTLKQISFNQVLGLTTEDKDTKIEEERALKAAKIDTYFESKGLPLAGHGMGMVLAAEKYGLDWRIIPSIAMKETTGGKFACPVTAKRTGDIRYTYNVFGWGSCGIKFESYEAGFDTIAKNLTGNNPATQKHYAGKDTVSILESYNPRHVVSDYPEQIMAIMEKIDNVSIDDTKEIAMR